MESTFRDGNLYEPAERQLPREETDETPSSKATGKAEDRDDAPTTGTNGTEGTEETDGTEQTGRAPDAPAKKEQRRTPAKAKEGKPSALCAGGRGVTHGGKEEGPGAERTGGGKTGERDDRLPDMTGLTVAMPPLASSPPPTYPNAPPTDGPTPTKPMVFPLRFNHLVLLQPNV